MSNDLDNPSPPPAVEQETVRENPLEEKESQRANTALGQMASTVDSTKLESK
ncbi:MAG: hypothetical protein QOE26_2788 [Verrucomicrobiota bacterium]|jgi:hypothetical protein